MGCRKRIRMPVRDLSVLSGKLSCTGVRKRQALCHPVHLDWAGSEAGMHRLLVDIGHVLNY